MLSIILVALGGAIGASLRYAIASMIAYRWPITFPLGTLLVNISGCFIVAFLMVKGFERGVLSSNWKLFLIIGIGGGYTTFSSFSFETVQLLREGLYITAVCNVFANVALGLGATILGVILSKI